MWVVVLKCFSANFKKNTSLIFQFAFEDTNDFIVKLNEKPSI